MATVTAPTRIAMHNIVAATDFSVCGEAAVEFAAALAHRFSSTLYTINVLPHTPFIESPDIADPEKMKQVAAKRMADVARSELFQGITHQELIREGEVAEVLSGLVRDRHIDLMVMGTEGRTGMGKFLLGSVAEEVFRSAECPVLTLGPHATRRHGDKLQHVLYATDFGMESVHALPYATALAEEHRARLTMLHVAREPGMVLPEPEPGAMPVVSPYEEVREGEQRMRELIAQDPPLSQPPELLVQFGAPAETIARVAAGDVDLIVLGVKRPGLLAKHLGGSVAYQVVCQAPCPVLSVGARFHRS